MGRKKRHRSVATFASTQSAIATEAACADVGIAGRLIPTPVAIRATCGLSWSMPPEERPRFEELIERENLAIESLVDLDL